MHSMHVPPRREPSRLYASDEDFAAVRARMAARMGRRLSQTLEEEEAAEQAACAALEAMRPHYQRRQRAYEAYRTKARTRRPRADRPPPKESRQYAPAMATTAARDERLVMGARACLQLIRALIGRAASRLITKAYLARALGCHVRTIQRYLSSARALGYIITEAVYDHTGRQIGQHIAITEKLRPYWEAAKSLFGIGETDVSSTKALSTKALSESESNHPRSCRENQTLSALSGKRERPPDQ